MSHKTVLVVLEGGCVLDVLNGPAEYDIWDWDNFADDPIAYWENANDEFKLLVREAFDSEVLETIQATLNEAYERRLEDARKDPFWAVEAR